MGFVNQVLLDQLCAFHRLKRNIPGAWRLGSWLGARRELLKGLPPRARKVWEGTYVFIDPSDFYDGNKYLVWGLNPKEPIANVICQLIRKGDCFLDIGANVGIHSALASVLVGRDGAVHAFEAVPDTFERLKVLETRNRFHNITAWNLAVSDKVGFVDIFPGPSGHTGVASLRRDSNLDQHGVTCPCRTIDSLAKDLPQVRLIKVDVEGAEMRVFKGMAQLIQRDYPYVITELTDRYLRDLGSSKEEVVGFFESLGYVVYRIGNPISKYVPADEDQCDILCVPANSQSVQWQADVSIRAH